MTTTHYCFVDFAILQKPLVLLLFLLFVTCWCAIIVQLVLIEIELSNSKLMELLEDYFYSVTNSVFIMTMKNGLYHIWRVPQPKTWKVLKGFLGKVK